MQAHDVIASFVTSWPALQTTYHLLRGGRSAGQQLHSLGRTIRTVLRASSSSREQYELAADSEWRENSKLKIYKESPSDTIKQWTSPCVFLAPSGVLKRSAGRLIRLILATSSLYTLLGLYIRHVTFGKNGCTARLKCLRRDPYCPYVFSHWRSRSSFAWIGVSKATVSC